MEQNKIDIRITDKPQNQSNNYNTNQHYNSYKINEINENIKIIKFWSRIIGIYALINLLIMLGLLFTFLAKGYVFIKILENILQQ